MNRVENKIAIVTGGAMGLGASACRLLAREGAKVAITDIDECGEDIAAAIRSDGGEARFWKLDTTDEHDVTEVFAAVAATYGRIDILVNNAGIAGVNKPTDQVSEAEWDRVMAVNVKGVFFGTKHVIAYMRQVGGGSIINLSSIYGLIGAADYPPYHASKGAVRLMSKTDAVTYAADRIRVNSIHPGYIWTPMVADVAAASGADIDTFKTKIGNLHPLGHLGEPDDVGWGVVYLASDESKFVTGIELVIDGGYTAR